MLLIGPLLVAGCAASNSGSPGFVDKALDLVGLQAKPPTTTLPADLSELASIQGAAKAPRRVTLRIHAAEVLNTDASGRSLSMLVKLYKLKELDPFMQAPYDSFKDQPGSRPQQIDGVIEVQEVVLTPGQKYEVVETLPAEVNYLAIVGLFRAPDDRRWRFAFDTKGATKTGITLGAHGCAFSVSEGQPVNAVPETMRLAGVQCR